MPNWARQSVSLNTGETLVNSVQYGAPAFFSYRSAADNLATISGANYFTDVVYNLSIADLIYIQASDTDGWLTVAAVDREAGTITTVSAGFSGSVGTSNIIDGAVTAAKLASDSVTTIKILNSNVTSAKIASNVIQQAQVSVTAAEFKGMYVTPKALVAAPGVATSQHLLLDARVFLDYGTTQFTGGGAVYVQYDSTTLGAGTKASATLAAAGFTGAVADSTGQFAGAQAVAAASTTLNKGLYLSNDTAAFAAGDSTFKVDVWYATVSYA